LKYDPRVTEQTWESLEPRETHYKAVFTKAKNNGWSPPISNDGWSLPEAGTEEEFEEAQLSPDCIVKDYLYEDVALLIAPGGVGKTTIILYEAIHIILGKDLYNLPVGKPGPVLIFTGEDSAETLRARTREICRSLHLSPDDTAKVRQDLRISDECGSGFKLTTTLLNDGAIVPTSKVDAIIQHGRALAPVLVIFDPAISFGIGEARVNDAEQALVEAARKIQNQLKCCVRFVHHAGKANSREATRDQYTARGGSAFPDGSRMVAVMQPLNAEGWVKETGTALLEKQGGIVLSRPKLSYAPPNQPDLHILRQGFHFTLVSANPQSTADRKQRELNSASDLVLAEVRRQVQDGKRPTKEALAGVVGGVPRQQVRDAVAALLSDGRIVKIKDTQHGGSQHYLRPADDPAGLT
jgi:RecA-family ATPase